MELGQIFAKYSHSQFAGIYVGSFLLHIPVHSGRGLAPIMGRFRCIYLTKYEGCIN